MHVAWIDEVKVVFVGQDVEPYLQLKASAYFYNHVRGKIPLKLWNTSNNILYGG